MKILIADDHPFVLRGIKDFVTDLGHKVECCDNGITALNLIKSHQPDISILDVKMPGMGGMEVLECVDKEKLKTKVVLITMYRERSIFEKAKQFNVYGYLLKNRSQEELAVCLEAVAKNKRYVSPHIVNDLTTHKPSNVDELIGNLTVTEKMIIKLISEHHTSKRIGELLFISENTVEGHRRNIIIKLGLPKKKNTLLHWTLSNMNKD